MLKYSNFLVTQASLMLVSAILSGCGGGGGGSAAPVTPPVTVTPPAAGTIAGTTATGAPITGQVVAIDANGQTFAATTNALGAYTVNVAGGTAPFILTVTGTAGGKMVTLNSLATAPGQTVNITPLTDLIVSAAAGQPAGTTLAALCASSVAADQTQCKAAVINATSGTRLSDAVTAVKGIIVPLDSTGADPLNGAFAADGSGMDAVLDKIRVAPATSQGAMATVTLVAVPTVQLGSVTLPATAGGTSTSATGTTTQADITAATDAQTALAEIRACLASLSALYPANMSVAPSASQVSPFIDATFNMNGYNASQLTSFLSTLATPTAGTNVGFAVPGLTFTASGYSKFDFTPQASGSLLTTAAPMSLTTTPATAWVRFEIGGTSNGGFTNFKMVKGAAYTGCAGGWKMAGSFRPFDMHMNARVAKWNFSNTITYTRELPFHVSTNVSDTYGGGISKIVVKGPGLSVYSGTPSAPVAAASPVDTVTLAAAPQVSPPAVRQSSMGILQPGSVVGNMDAIQSCQDLAAAGTAATGTPCYDEAAVAPGAVYAWTVFDTAATPAVISVFPYQIASVPLSKAFAIANDKDLFAQNIAASPAGATALNTAAAGFAAGANLDGIISFSYTNSTVYGTQTNHCGIGVTDASNNVVLRAEQNADGLPTQQTSCTFNTAGLNSGSLVKPAVAFGGTNSYMNIGNFVLGNMVTTSQSF